MSIGIMKFKLFGLKHLFKGDHYEQLVGTTERSLSV